MTNPIITNLVAAIASKAAVKTAIIAKGVPLDGVPFSEYATKVSAIPAATPIFDGSESPPTPYVRPVDWLALPALTDASNKAVGLYAIPPQGSYCAVSATGGAYMVDWGDGVVDNVASGVTAMHAYSYASPALDGSECSRGYKQALVSVFPQAGQTLTQLNFNVKHTAMNAVSYYTTFWLDLAVAISSLTTLQLGSEYPQATHMSLEQVALYDNAVTNMSYLMGYCQSLVSMPVFKTPSLTNAAGMFHVCYSLEKVPLFDMSKVTAANYMFYSCYLLKEVPLFDLSAATTTSNMFNSCKVLQSVPLFNTVKVTTMNSMFEGCWALRVVPQFNTQKVYSLGGMFRDCYSLVNAPHFDTPLAAQFDYMFVACRSLVKVPLYDMGSAINTQAMFMGCTALRSVPLMNTANVTNMSYMFNACQSLQTVPLFNTAKVTTMNSMFSSCGTLLSVPLFNTVSVTNMSYMFSSCGALKTVLLFDTAKVTDASSMFSNASSLKTVPLFNLAACTNVSTMFSSCGTLRAVPAFVMPLLISMSNFTLGCRGLIFFPTIDASNVTSIDWSFEGTNFYHVGLVGVKITFSVASNVLSVASLNELFTNLATVTGKTISIGGNPGAATCNRSIATAKGWTVIG